MTRLAVLWTITGLLACSLLTTGCCENEKKQLAALQQQYNDLQVTNQDLKKSLAQCQARATELETQLSGRDSQLTALKAELADAKQKLTAKGSSGSKAPPPGWQKVAGGVKITLSSDILFASGRATLSSAGVAKLRKVAATIRSKYPNAIVRVYGYTDADPIVKSARLWRDNLDLSANRAMAVTRQLRKLHIPAEQIETVAMGATHFVAPNKTRAEKAKNRRVEIVVVGK
ncbi:MAG: hypothetical protein B1H04_06000 [Planctomycetales bacterium 4484_123]|nr:MAG: hypothetical protein B1H04_06000 [Planctomycetales bacterium 4484_123]